MPQLDERGDRCLLDVAGRDDAEAASLDEPGYARVGPCRESAGAGAQEDAIVANQDDGTRWAGCRDEGVGEPALARSRRPEDEQGMALDGDGAGVDGAAIQATSAIIGLGIGKGGVNRLHASPPEATR